MLDGDAGRPPPPAAKSGRCRATGSASRTLPASTSVITDVAVATTLVSEARSNTVSTVIGSGLGTRARWP